MFRQVRPRIWGRILLLLLGGSALTLTAFSSPALGQEIIKTQKAVIYADSPGDLQEMERRLNFSPAANITQQYSANLLPAGCSPHPRLAAKVDGLLQRVCAVLRLWPQNQPPLRIFLLKNGQEVKKRHLVFQPHQEKPLFGLFGYSHLEGFYEARSNAIFLSLADLHEGVLAHEMTHAVLCKAVSPPPPEDLQEEWARYVETRIN
ncbi:MAG: hypothetical protein AB1491_09665 [Thermodesulfobacteriota bacterium]